MQPARSTPDAYVQRERLRCPGCEAVTTLEPPPRAGVEEVKCQGCGKLLRCRPALGAEQYAQALVLRWAAAELAKQIKTPRGRKFRGDWQELRDLGLGDAVDLLLKWSQTIHKRPPVHE